MNLKQLYQRFHDWQLDPFQNKKTELKQHRCAGCGATYEGKYCPVCGQSHDVGKVSWRTIRNDLTSIFGLDSNQSALLFVIQLFGRPGYLINDYINGRRKICRSPVGMLGVLAVLAVLVNTVSPHPRADWVVLKSQTEGLVGTLLSWLADNLNWAVLIQTILLVFPTWLFFRKSPRNTRHTLPQGIYIQVFMGSLVLICIMLRNLLGDWVLSLIPLFYFIAYRQLFGYGIWGTCWRTLLCLGSVLLLFGGLMMAGMHWAGA